MIFKVFAILSAVIAIAPIITLVVLSSAVSEASMGNVVGFGFAYSIAAAPFVFFAGCILGAILQGIYSFSVAKSLFVRLKNFTIYRSENGHFLVFFKEKIERKIQTHRLEIELLDSNHCHLTHSTTEDAKEWKEICSKNFTIDECETKYFLSMQGNCSALFAFFSHCLSLKPKDNAPLLLHASTFDFDAKEFPIPQEIELLHAQDNKTITKRFFALMGVILSLVFAVWLYVNSAFYPCSLYSAIVDKDTQKLESLLQAGANPNVMCNEDVDPLKALLPHNTTNKESPLLYAISTKDHHSINLLLEHGAKVLFGNENALKAAARVCDTKTVALLLQRDDVHTFIDYQYGDSHWLPDTPLITVLREMRNDTPQIVRMLLESGADANKASSFGTPLKAALFNGYPQKARDESVKLLIEYGAEVNDSRYLPLAFERANKEIIELLMHKGAYNGSEEQKEKILESALRRRTSKRDERDEEYEEILQMALDFKPSQESLDDALTKYFTMSQMRLLLQHNANINAQDHFGNTLLMIYLGMIETNARIIYLLEHNAAVNVLNNEGKSALDLFENFKNNSYNTRGERAQQTQKIEALLKAKGAKSGAEL